MEEMMLIADGVNFKINRIIKAIEASEGSYGSAVSIAILESLKVMNIQINTDKEIFIRFKDDEILKVR